MLRTGLPSDRTSHLPPDAQRLAAELKSKIQGEVRFDDGSRALYATDLSAYPQVPIGVVIPRDIDDVVQTVAACRRYEVPILGRGCGTSLAGQCCNIAVVIDFSKYINGLRDLDPNGKTAWVEPRVIRDQLRDAAEVHHLTLAPDPATHAYCTIGGMIGNNSCGSHSVMGGRTSDNVEELDILTYYGRECGWARLTTQNWSASSAQVAGEGRSTVGSEICATATPTSFGLQPRRAAP